MHIPPWVYAALDGFTFGGLLSTGRPSRPTSIFPEEGREEEAMAQFIASARRHNSRSLVQDLVQQVQLQHKKSQVRGEAEQRGEPNLR